MKKYKTYKKQRYLFFWLAIAVCFVPYVVATSCLLPFMVTSDGQRVAIGLAVVFLNALPFVGGVLLNFRAHFPFFNLPALLFIVLAGFFLLDVFADYVSSFLVIETTAFVGGIAACVLWHFHRKYKRKSRTVSDVVKSGLVEV